MCDCSEERDRQERQRKRQEETQARAEEAAFVPDAEPEPAFSPLKIAGGTLGLLLALTAFLLKTVDHDTLRAYLDIVGLGHLLPKSKPNTGSTAKTGSTGSTGITGTTGNTGITGTTGNTGSSSRCLNPAKQKWPAQPPSPPCPPLPKKREPKPC